MTDIDCVHEHREYLNSQYASSERNPEGKAKRHKNDVKNGGERNANSKNRLQLEALMDKSCII